MINLGGFEGEQPDGDAAYLVMPYAEQSAIGGVDLYHRTLLRPPVDACHSPGEDPRVKAQYGFFLLGLEVNLTSDHDCKY